MLCFQKCLIYICALFVCPIMLVFYTPNIFNGFCAVCLPSWGKWNVWLHFWLFREGCTAPSWFGFLWYPKDDLPSHLHRSKSAVGHERQPLLPEALGWEAPHFLQCWCIQRGKGSNGQSHMPFMFSMPSYRLWITQMMGCICIFDFDKKTFWLCQVWYIFYEAGYFICFQHFTQKHICSIIYSSFSTVFTKYIFNIPH